MLQLVISGAQDGADIAGLRAARASGIQTGGFMPKGRRTKSGFLPLETFQLFGLTETDSSAYPIRTEKNVVASDATIRFAHTWYSPGERLTQRLLIKHKKPRWDIELRRDRDGKWSAYGLTKQQMEAFAATTAKWLLDHEVEILNIAGNGDQDIEEFVQWFLMVVFRKYRDMSQRESHGQANKDMVEGRGG